jgi:hypothetical protein
MRPFCGIFLAPAKSPLFDAMAERGVGGSPLRFRPVNRPPSCAAEHAALAASLRLRLWVAPVARGLRRKRAPQMANPTRRAAYASLWVFALAFGWIEASVVVYLREIAAGDAWLRDPAGAGLPIALVSLTSRLTALEMLREACTIVLLGAVAWLAGRRLADRAGAFLLSFGIWDLAYYASLYVVLGWPEHPGAWDVLFLIPVPWVAPVWAPASAALLFVAAGTYLYWTPDRERRYRRLDAAVLVAGVLLTIASFLNESGAAVERRAPGSFPAWLFWAGVGLGAAWFVRVERRPFRRRPDGTTAVWARQGGEVL